MSYKSPNIIASEDLGEFDVWRLPDVGDATKVLPSAEKEQKDRVARSDEIIEEVDLEESLELSPITAEELQAITEAAEKEGFIQGEKAGFEQGQKEGHEQGYQAGLEKAEQESRPVFEQQVAQLLQVAEALIDPISHQQQQLETTLLDYVTSLTRQLVERELLQDSSHILGVVKQAITALPVGSSHTTVCLNPDDLAVIETFSEENNKDWKFRGDPQILPGGCRIQTDESLVDFTIESKLQAMFGQFLDRQLTSSSDESEDLWSSQPQAQSPETESITASQVVDGEEELGSAANVENTPSSADGGLEAEHRSVDTDTESKDNSAIGVLPDQTVGGDTPTVSMSADDQPSDSAASNQAGDKVLSENAEAASVSPATDLESLQSTQQNLTEDKGAKNSDGDVSA